MEWYWFVESQGHILLVLFLVGAGLGVFYDLIRVGRRLLGASRLVMNVTDVFYWLVVTAVLWDAQNQAAQGVFRLCQLLAVALGMISYYSMLSAKVLWLVYTPLHFLAKELVRVYRYTIGRVVSKSREEEKRMAYEKTAKKKEKK